MMLCSTSDLTFSDATSRSRDKTFDCRSLDLRGLHTHQGGSYHGHRSYEGGLDGGMVRLVGGCFFRLRAGRRIEKSVSRCRAYDTFRANTLGG